MAMIQIPSVDGVLRVSADVPGSDPETLFEYWTRPELLTQWWPMEAEVGNEVGGAYRLSWTGEMESTLQGKITAFDPGRKLGFTWKWNFQPEEKVPLDVVVAYEPLPEGGTRMLIEHGPFDPVKDEKARDGAIGGWEFFLERLQNLIDPDPEE